tara:strand:- start:1099 stop:1806 length:708 start_codon:yes stop_codon:yes gene_type:complete
MKLGLSNNIKQRGGAVFSIDSLSGLNLWLKFNTGQTTPDIDEDDEADIKWADSSGNNNHATQTEDALEGSFVDGNWSSENNDQFLNLTSNITLTDDFTIFIVFVFEGTNDTFIGSSTGDFMRFGHGNVPTIYKSKFSGGLSTVTITAPTTAKGLFKIERNATDKLEITQNTTTTLVTNAALNAGDFVFNKIPAGSFGLSDDYLSELVIFDRILTATEIANVEADILDRIPDLTAD